MAQRLDVVAVRSDGSKVVLTDQPSDSNALWHRIRLIAQSGQSVEIRRHATPAPPPTRPPLRPSVGQRVVYFSAMTDRAAHEFAACGPLYTARLSADLHQSGLGGAYFVTDAQIQTLRSGGGRVEGWADGDSTSIDALKGFVRARGLDAATAQYETPGQWAAFQASGLVHAIGNPAALIGTPYLQAAIDAAGGGRAVLIGEVMQPDPGYSAQGVPVSSVCFYIDRDDAQGGYLPLAAYSVMPVSLRASCSVYTGGRMSADDWQTFRDWTRSP